MTMTTTTTMTMTTSDRVERGLPASDGPDHGATVVRWSGHVDDLGADPLTEAVAASASPALASRRMVADCSEVTCASSAGLRSILAMARTCRALGGDLRLAAMQPQVSRVLRITGFTSLIRVYDDVPTAVASFGARPRPSPAH